MNVKIDISNNYFYVPTQDLQSSIVAKGDISINLQKIDKPSNWSYDLDVQNEIEVLRKDLGEKISKKENKNESSNKKEKKVMSESQIKQKKIKEIWYSRLSVEEREKKLKMVDDELKIVRLFELINQQKSMELEVKLDQFEIYLTDMSKIIQENSKLFSKRLAIARLETQRENNEEEEEENIKETKEIVPKRTERKKNKSSNKRQLLLPWTFDLQIIEYKGYKEIIDSTEEEKRLMRIYQSNIPLDESLINEKNENTSYQKSILQGAEKEGEVQYPVIKLRNFEGKASKAIMHCDRILNGKLDKLIFDISLKDIQLLQKIQTFHLGVYSDHTQKVTENIKEVNKEKPKNVSTEEVLEENIISSMKIGLTVDKPLRISLVNDFENVFVRSLVIQISKFQINGELGSDSEMNINFGLEMMYYNSSLTTWEPVLEKTNIFVQYSQIEESISKQINDILEQRAKEYDLEMQKRMKKKKLNKDQMERETIMRKTTLKSIKEQELDVLNISPKNKTILKIMQGFKMEDFEGEELKFTQKQHETMNLNITMAFIEKLIYFQKVSEQIKAEGEKYSQQLSNKSKKLLEIKNEDQKKSKNKKGEGVVSPARIVNRTGYPIYVTYNNKQVKIQEGKMNIDSKKTLKFEIQNMRSEPLTWDNFKEENLFNDDEFSQENTQMNTFNYKTISFRINHPKFKIDNIKNLSLNDNFDRKLVTKGKQRILSDFRVLCNSRNIGDLKEITISSQILIENQLIDKNCRRIINIETIHPFGRSIITIKPGQKKYVPFDLVNFETRVYANRDIMQPQNIKFNNFILKERNYKTIFYNKDFSYNFILKVERDPKFFFLTRLVAVPAISFKNDLPYPLEIFLSRGIQKEVIRLEPDQYIKKCDFAITDDVSFKMGILKPNIQTDISTKENIKQIIRQIEEDPYSRYHLKSRGKIILQGGKLGADYKKILSLYDKNGEKTYFSIVRWITPDSYFGFLIYTDSAIINETPYQLLFKGQDIDRKKEIYSIPQFDSNLIPDNKLTLLSSKRSSLEIKLHENQSNLMTYFSTKYSNKISTQGLVNGVFIINLQKNKKIEAVSEKNITSFIEKNENITQSQFVGGNSNIETPNMSMIFSQIHGEHKKLKKTEIPSQEIFPFSEEIKASKMYIEIGYKVSLVSSKENKGLIATKVIQLTPKTIISNETEFQLRVKQKNSTNIFVHPKTKKPLYAFVGENGKNKLFCVSLIQDDEIFSSQVEVDFNKGGSISLIMLNENKQKWKIVRIEMLIEASYMFVKINDRTGCNDMIIKNNMNQPVKIYQHKHKKDFTEYILPNESREIAWVDPYQNQKLVFEILSRRNAVDNTISERIIPNQMISSKNIDLTQSNILNLNENSNITKISQIGSIKNIQLNDFLYKTIDEAEIEIQNLKKADIKTKSGKKLTVDIKLEGFGRLIELESTEKHIEEEKQENLIKKEGGKPVFTFYLNLPQVGVSIIAKSSRQRKELFYIYLNETNFFYETEGPNTLVQFQIRYLNIDNNYSTQCRFPVLFTCGMSLNEMIKKEAYMINCILKMVDTSKNNPKEIKNEENSDNEKDPKNKMSVTCFDEISLELSPLVLTVEFSLIAVMMEFQEQLSELTSSSEVKATYLSKYFDPNIEQEDIEWIDLAQESSTWIYCNKLNISLLKIILTFNMNKDEPDELSKSEDSYFNVVLNTLGTTILNFDESPLSFKGIQLFYVFESSNGLISLYKQHILDQAKLNAMKLLGSFDILGNPTNLFGNVGNGVVQFFEKPVEGFKKGPISGIKGIATGSTALLKNTAAGTLNAISKFTGSLASGLTILSNDKTYQKQRNLKKAKKPKGVLEGLESGAKSIGKGIWSGVTGIITQPVKEVKKSGAVGLFKGMFKGLTGVITKPLGGILDATSQTTEGIKKTITKGDDKANENKQRPPRVFYSEKKIIKIYDNEHAKRIKALVKVENTLENESLIDSVELNLTFNKKPTKCILIITNNCFVLMNSTLEKILIKCNIVDVKKVDFKQDNLEEKNAVDSGNIHIKYKIENKEYDFLITSKMKKITRIMQSIYYTRYMIYLKQC